jgi:Rod binding domain-containing protein
MDISSVASSIASPSLTDVEKLKDEKPTSLAGEKARLKKATKAFEAFFMYQMLKTMRETVHESSLEKGGPFSGGMGKDIFTEMFDMQMSNKMATGGKNSISDMLYRSLEKVLEAQQGNQDGPVEIKPLKQEKSGPIQLQNRDFENIQRPEKQIKINANPTKFLPNPARARSVPGDTILSKFGKHIDDAAKQSSLDPALIISVIQAESAGNPNAVSSAGAKGLMQLSDSTASDYGVGKVFNPSENIKAGSKYLRNLIDRFGSVKLGLAAYNAGPGNVEKYNGMPPFKETRDYVNKVLDTLKTISGGAPSAAAKVHFETTDK